MQEKSIKIMQEKYVKTKGKTRTDKEIYTKEQITAPKYNGDYGRLIEYMYVMFDFDNQNHANIISCILKEKHLKCKILYTTRGIHVLFKTDLNKIANKNHCFNWIGLECDIKGVGIDEEGKECYQAIKVNGVVRKEEYLNGATTDDDLDIAPKWLYHVPSKKEQIDLTLEHEGHRNDLFFYDLKYRAKKYGFTCMEYQEQARIINTYVLIEGLPEAELEQAIREEAWDELVVVNENEKEKKLYAIIAEAVIHDWNCLWANGEIAFFNQNINRYDTKEVVLKGYLQQKYKNQNMTTTNMKEVLEQMKIQLENDKNLHRERNTEYVLCNNQLVSMLKDDVIANTREIYTDVYYPYKIMTEAELKEYEENKKIGYKFLNDISCNDETIKQVICEMLGCMLAPTNHFQRIFICYGSGANGKSVLIKVMQKIMGDLLTNANILKINERFALSRAYKGIANVTDDVGITTIKETGLLKSIISGSTIEIEKKNHDPISWTPNSQFVIACNQIPRINDTSKGMIRRLFFIPFKMQLEAGDMDIDMLEKLLGTSIKLPEEERNDNTLRYIMTKAIFAYREARRRGHLTETAEHKKLLEIFKEENEGDIKSFYNALLKQEGGIEGLEAWIDNRPLQEIFDEYAIFLGYNSSEEITHITQRAFLVNFNKLLPPSITRKNVTVCGHTIKKYVVTK